MVATRMQQKEGKAGIEESSAGKWCAVELRKMRKSTRFAPKDRRVKSSSHAQKRKKETKDGDYNVEKVNSYEEEEPSKMGRR